MALYDQIGHGYARMRQEDPHLRQLIFDALGGAASVVNVGAGAGSYEPRDRHVIAIEPSAVMAAQRPPHLTPAIRAWAAALPLHDGSVDAAMAVLSLHHWGDQRQQGVRELRRVSRGPIVVVTIDPAVSRQMWLMRDYLPEIADLDDAILPAIDDVADWLGGAVTVDTVPVARGTPDRTLLSFWAHPRRVLDPAARAAASGLARMPSDVIDRVVSELARDLDSGAWHRRNGYLDSLDALDAGLRLVTAQR